MSLCVGWVVFVLNKQAENNLSIVSFGGAGMGFYLESRARLAVSAELS